MATEHLGHGGSFGVALQFVQPLADAIHHPEDSVLEERCRGVLCHVSQSWALPRWLEELSNPLVWDPSAPLCCLFVCGEVGDIA